MVNVQAVLVTFLYFEGAIAIIRHNSASFKGIQTSVHYVSTADTIACAFRAKDETLSGVRVNEDTGQCEGVDGSHMIGASYPPNFQYYEKEVQFWTFSPLQALFERAVIHPLLSEVKVTDKFQFVFNKSGIDRISIALKDNIESKLVMFRVLENTCKISDKYEGVVGVNEIKPYIISDFKVYTLTFQVEQSYWQIYVDGNAFTTFAHRHPIEDITRIVVKTGPQIDYLSKYENPKLPT